MLFGRKLTPDAVQLGTVAPAEPSRAELTDAQMVAALDRILAGFSAGLSRERLADLVIDERNRIRPSRAVASVPVVPGRSS